MVSKPLTNWDAWGKIGEHKSDSNFTMLYDTYNILKHVVTSENILKHLNTSEYLKIFYNILKHIITYQLFITY